MPTLYGWGPMFGLPGPSPFVMKCDTQLQMLGVEFVRAIADLDGVSKRKAPYVEDDGEIIQDSTFIRCHFEAKLGKDLDEGLSQEERATAWALERLAEDRLALIGVSERWLIDENFDKGPRLFFMGVPEEVREDVAQGARAQLRGMLEGHGLLRHSREERMFLADKDITALSMFLGEKDFMFGDQPSGLDASANAVLAMAGTTYFESPLVALVDRHANLRPYLERMNERYFAKAEWPAMAA